MTRELRLDLEVLIWLRAGGDNLTPETQLRTDLRNALNPAPIGSEISDALNRVQARKWAVDSRESEGDDVKWAATALGLSQLTKRGL